MTKSAARWFGVALNLALYAILGMALGAVFMIPAEIRALRKEVAEQGAFQTCVEAWKLDIWPDYCDRHGKQQGVR